MRWWWFGSAVTQAELERELRAMKDGGIGGVEIQPVYPLSLDDAKSGIHNDPYLSPAFLNNLRFAAAKAREFSLQVSVTLGSGWPFGGPHIGVAQAAGKLRYDKHEIPWLESGEQLIAPHFIASRTGQQVKRASVGAEGFVLDHYDPDAVRHHLAAIGEELLDAFGDHPPSSVFSDSLEVFGTDWTPTLLSDFKARRGYDLAAELPALIHEPATEHDLSVRHDWALTLSELADDHFLKTIADWAHSKGTLFRSQTYGEPPVTLSSNRFVDLPEGEAGPHWRTFSTARWASSASHLYGRNVTSSETWTWLHAPSFRATPLDMKAEADLHFIQGVNQLVGHGWPYSPPGVAEPGQRFYAAASLNDHNPWFVVMPEIASYLQRVSYLLRQGEPANDIALYLPSDDALAAARPGKVTVDRQMEALLDPKLIPWILDAGYNLDFIDDAAIQSERLKAKALVLPDVKRMPLRTLEALRQFRSAGGKLVAAGRLPDTAPGLAESAEALQIMAAARKLFTSRLETLPQLVTPDLEGSDPAIGFLHRHLPEADIYFLANTANRRVAARPRFRDRRKFVERWNPFTGEVCALGPSGEVETAFQPYESTVFAFVDTSSAQPCPAEAGLSSVVSLDEDWNVHFDGQSPILYSRLHSWSEDENTRFYSGRIVYEKTVTLPKASANAVLDFGPGQPVAAPSEPSKAPGMRALLESPVREAAVIYVNGVRAGAVWRPPYRIVIGPYLRRGTNKLRITATNTAVNTMAGRELPSYRLLNARYGERFTPQGFEGLAPLPSGILPGLRLLY